MEENGGICYLIEKEKLLPCVVSSYSRLQGYNNYGSAKRSYLLHATDQPYLSIIRTLISYLISLHPWCLISGFNGIGCTGNCSARFLQAPDRCFSLVVKFMWQTGMTTPITHGMWRNLLLKQAWFWERKCGLKSLTTLAITTREAVASTVTKGFHWESAIPSSLLLNLIMYIGK